MTHTRWTILATMAVFAAVNVPLVPANNNDKDKTTAARLPDAVLPKASEVVSLDVKPGKTTLKGLDDANQIIVTGKLAGDKLVDLPHSVKYEAADEKVTRASTTGRLMPLLNGTTPVTVRYGDKTAKIDVTNESCDEDLPINFGNQ